MNTEIPQEFASYAQERGCEALVVPYFGVEEMNRIFGRKPRS